LPPDSRLSPQLRRRLRKFFTWVTLRKAVQLSSLAAFLILFVTSRQSGLDPSLLNLPMRLDLLAMLANALASKSFLIGSSVAIIVLILTLVAGRAWCGWLCPLGATLDILTPRRKKYDESKAPSASWRTVKYGLLLTTLVAALFGNLTLLIFDPLTIFFRTLTVSVWPPLDQLTISLERGLAGVDFLQDPLSSFDSALRPAILPSLPLYYRDVLLFAAVFVAVVALNWIAPRFWCRYLCPLGALLGLLSKVAVFRRVVGESCKDCAVCSARCPTGTIDPNRGYASDPSECTMCLDCLELCPRSSIRLAPGLKPASWQKYDPSRRQFFASIGLAIAGVAIFQSGASAARQPSNLIRPPGAAANDLLLKCVRCGECIRACPTGALQPAQLESGLEGLWTPVVVPRLGPCSFGCNACGQMCPVQAIPPLNLADKQQTVIGRAYIDKNRCIAWADHRACIVCEEMCPVADKAVKLETQEVDLGDGVMVTVQLPSVFRELCIGCGICEYKCPVNGDAAIRVYVPEKFSLYE
jgi:MauM/NapG family ferredoxin protein